MWASATSDRFVSCIETSAVDQLFRYEGTLIELEPVERSLNGYVESLKQDDLNEELVADGLNRCVDTYKVMPLTSLGPLPSCAT
jgi:dynactin 1